jgi:hypothetical protein
MNTMKVHSVILYYVVTPILLDARYNVWVCGCSLAGMVGSNTAKGVDACLF